MVAPSFGGTLPRLPLASQKTLRTRVSCFTATQRTARQRELLERALDVEALFKKDLADLDPVQIACLEESRKIHRPTTLKFPAIR